MGWPPCMADGCDTWPAVGFTGCCAECIKDPAKVEKVASKMNANHSFWTHRIDEQSYRLAWLSREPNGSNLKMVYDLLQAEPGLAFEAAIDRARNLYWSTLNSRPASQRQGTDK